MRYLPILVCGALACGSPTPRTESSAQSSDPHVVGPNGEPIAFAQVAVVSRTSPLVLVSTDERGVLSLPRINGDYSVTISAPGYLSRFVQGADLLATRRIELNDETGLEIVGQIVFEPGREGSSFVRVAAWANLDHEVYVTPANESGRFRIRIPAGSYSLQLHDDQYVSPEYRAAGDSQMELTVSAYKRELIEDPAPAAVLAWLSEHLRSTAAVDQLIGDAVVVGLGEATHGTAEFFSWKQDIIEQLILRRQFNVVAFEASWAESLALNEFVVHGRGDVNEALAGVHFWTLDTEEVVALLRWLRSHNSTLPLHQRVRVYGFDMQHADAGVQALIDYASRVDKQLAQELEQRLSPLRGKNVRESILAYRNADKSVRDGVRAALADAKTRLVSSQAAYAQETSQEDWIHAVQQASVLEQTELLWATQRFDLSVDHRNKSMADNIEWLAANVPNAKIAAWAHNGHLARKYTFGNIPAGWHLAATFGAKYVSLAFLFGQGSFRAWDTRTEDGPKKGVVPIRVGPPPKGFAELAFMRANTEERYLVDLRQLPKRGPVADWFLRPHYLREFGAAYEGDVGMELRCIPEQYDVVAFVQETTAARPTATGVRPPQE